jgi:hypothetical protein
MGERSSCWFQSCPLSVVCVDGLHLWPPGPSQDGGALTPHLLYLSVAMNGWLNDTLSIFCWLESLRAVIWLSICAPDHRIHLSCRHDADLSVLQRGTSPTGPLKCICLPVTRYRGLLSALRSMMPTSRVLLLGLLPRFDMYTLPGYPGKVFYNYSQVLGAPYDKGAQQVCPGRVAFFEGCAVSSLLLWGHSVKFGAGVGH